MKRRMENRPAPASVSRRELLRVAPLLLFPTSLVQVAAAREPAVERTPEGRIIRSKEPLNLEFPFSTLDGFLVPNSQFYVRNHFPQPRIEARDWRLRVGGLVRQPLELTYDDLRKLPSRALPVLLECAGNGRSFLEPKTKGVQWASGAVGTAEWTGVPLRAILQRAGLRPGAVEVVLEGADGGEVGDVPGRVRFARSLPIWKAREDALLAYRMNGVDLPPAHGFPVRAIVPDWYGVSSVKWLTRIVVTGEPFRGYFQSVDYTYWSRPNEIPALAPLTELSVKSQVARPAPAEVVPAGKPYRVFGAAWSGQAEVTRVEVSTDGGKSWAPARLLGKPTPHAWRLWEYDWAVPGRARTHAILSRATDARGRQQPVERDPDRRNYMINHLLPTEVTVR